MCMDNNSIQQWLDKTLGTDSSRKAAQLTGVSNSTISRAKRLGAMEVQNIVQIARGYNLNVLTALVECEIITAEEANQQDLASIARSLPDDVFVWEFAMRLRNDPEYWATVFDNPTAEPEPAANVFPLLPDGDVDIAQLKKDYPYAANSSPAEPGPGDPGYHDGP